MPHELAAKLPCPQTEERTGSSTNVRRCYLNQDRQSGGDAWDEKAGVLAGHHSIHEHPSTQRQDEREHRRKGTPDGQQNQAPLLPCESDGRLGHPPRGVGEICRRVLRPCCLPGGMTATRSEWSVYRGPYHRKRRGMSAMP